MRFAIRFPLVISLLLTVGLSARAQEFALDSPEEGSVADRAYGAFLGLAYGDAKGALTETYTANQIRRVMGRRTSLTDPLPLQRILSVRGPANYARLRIPGYVTDDGQQATALLLLTLLNPEILTHKSRDGSTYSIWEGVVPFANLLRAGDEAGAWRGTGSSFKGAVAKLRHLHRLERVVSKFEPATWRDHVEIFWRKTIGLPHGSEDIYDPRYSGQFADSNGAAMRTGALGALVDPRFTEEFLENVVISSGLVTHADVRAVAMSYAMFKAVRLLVQGRAAEQVRAELPPAVSRVELKLLEMKEWKKRTTDPHAVSRTLREVFHRLGHMNSFEQVSQLVERYGVPRDYDYRNRLHPLTASTSSATLSGAHALALALGDHVSPDEVVDYAVNFGDDSDTVAAMAGSLLGARFGLYWIEFDQLSDRARLWKYAKALVSGRAPETVDEYIAAEAERTRSEIQFQKDLPPAPPAAACVQLLDGLYDGRPLLEQRDYLD